MSTLTCTSHSSIFIMYTVVYSQLIMGAVYQLLLKTSTTDIVKKDRTRARTKVSAGGRERERTRGGGVVKISALDCHHMDGFCLSRV